VTGGNPDDILADARQLLDDHAGMVGSGWARSTALLIRQALEAALATYWHGVAPGMNTCDLRAQLVSLRFYLDEPDAARLAHQTWAVLSQACHHRAYELAPTAAELQQWTATVAEIIDSLAGGRPRTRPDGGGTSSAVD